MRSPRYTSPRAVPSRVSLCGTLKDPARCAMFKWACLAVAAAFLGALGWMVNDVRLGLRRSGQVLHQTGLTVNEHLPEITQKLRTATATVVELTEDIRQLRELACLPSGMKRDEGIVAYATRVLGALERSGGVIGVKKLRGAGLKDPVPAKEWVVAARREALVMAFLVKSRQEMLTRLAKNWYGSPWYLQLGDREPVALLDWLQAQGQAEHLAPGADLGPDQRPQRAGGPAARGRREAGAKAP